MTLPRIYCFLLLCTCVLAEDVTSRTCFTIPEARPVISRGTQGLTATAKSFTRNANKGITFHARGDTTSRAMWNIPLGYDMPVRYDMAFAVQARNIKSPGNRPNLYVALTPMDAGSKLLARKIPAFVAGGINGKELGSIRFVCPEGYKVDSLVIDLYLASDGDASLTIESLEIEHQTNLPNDSALNKHLKMWEGAGGAFGRKGKGVATITIAGKTLSCDGVALGTNPQPALVKRLISTGGYPLNQVTIPLGGKESIWEMPGYFNSQRLEEIVTRASAPGSAVILEVDLSSPPDWWSSKDKSRPSSDHSVFNTAWQRYCKDAIRYTVAALAVSGKSVNVMAVVLKFSSDPDASLSIGRAGGPDISTHFRDWLKNEYFDNTALATAWKQPSITFKTARWTPNEKWPRGLLGPLGPEPPPAVRDSIRFHQESSDGFNLNLMRYVKELTVGKCLTGFTIHPGRYKTLLRNSYYRPTVLKTIFDSDVVDFVEVMNWEPDFLPATPFQNEKPILARLDVSRITKVESLRDIMRLAFSSAIGIDGFVFETSRLMNLTDKRVVSELGHLKKARELNSVASRQSEVAFVVDPGFLDNALPVAGVPIAGLGKGVPRSGMDLSDLHYLYETARKLWPYTGVPYDTVSIDDLEPDLPYKVLVFFHCVHMTPERLERIDAMKKRGRTLVWSWADAVMTGGKFAISSVKPVTGINIRLSPKPQRLFMVPTPALNRLMGERKLLSTPGGIVSTFEPQLAERRAFSPSFEINDDSVDVWATHIDTGRPSMGTRKFFRWRSVYSASPAINPEIMRAIALKSDAHVYYYHNDPFSMNDNVVVIHARSTGSRSLTFDNEIPLFEVFESREFNASRLHRFKVTKGKTYLFFRGKKADWQNTIAK